MCHASKEAREIGWDPISGSHQGQRPQRPHSSAEYMAAPERFAEMTDFSLAPRAPMVWTPPTSPGRMSDVDCSEEDHHAGRSNWLGLGEVRV